MKMDISQRLQTGSKIHPKPNDYKRIYYGTAGFRDKANLLDHVFFRVGLVAALRSQQTKSIVAVMITASHNPAEDNGVKIVDPSGEMLESSWEPVVEIIANCEDECLGKEIDIVVQKYGIDTSWPIFTQLGRDTRESGHRLLQSLIDGVNCFVAEGSIGYHDYGIITTPILHYLVAKSNIRKKIVDENEYYEDLASAFLRLHSTYDKLCDKLSIKYKPKLIVDCAHGVGAQSLFKMRTKLDSRILDLDPINTGDGELNYKCGADFVKTHKQPPESASQFGLRYASLDGDADRLIYFYLESAADDEKNHKLTLVDGDKLAILIAIYVRKLLQKSHLVNDLSMALIQTAYANGASTRYIENALGLKVDCVDTGVKNLHRQAQLYDVAVYFEANGHGTVTFSQMARDSFATSSCERLKDILSLINPYIGDAVSCLMLIETILRHLDWSIQDLAKIYKDSPNRLVKVAVKDKHMIQTSDAGRKCVAPDGLQVAIDSVISRFGHEARSFVRPSGTEDVVRIYAEGTTESVVDEILEQVTNLVKSFTSES